MHHNLDERFLVKEGRVGFRLDGLFCLARDGHTNAKGLPDPLQLALFAPEFRDVFILRRPPSWAQSAIFAILGPIARARGYRATYPRYGRSKLPPADVSG